MTLFIVIDLLLTLLLAGVAGGQLARKADHRVVRVDKEACAAQIVPSRSPGRPRPGDLATTRIPD